MRLERWIYTVPLRLRALFRRQQLDHELDDELRDHIDRQIEEHIAKGLTPKQARTLVLRAFGGVERRKEECRDMRRVNVLEDLWKDLKHAVRVLRRRPSFTAVSVLTLGVGIAANTAIFSVVYGVLLKPLPFNEPDRLVGVWHTGPRTGDDPLRTQVAYYFTYRDESRTFDDIGLWNTRRVSITGRGEPEQVQALFVTDGTLPILSVQPLLGRLFTKADDAPGGPDRTVLTYGYWRRFGGARDILGQTVTIDGKPHEVIGVLPASFKFLDRNPAVLLPLQLNRAETHLGGFPFSGIARLKPGVTTAQANEDVARMIPLALERFAPPPGFPREGFEVEPNVRPLSAGVIGDVGRVLWILLGTVGIVLLIACANVANLFLVRAEGRQQELAVRTALGAGPGRLARELLGESLTLGLGGGLLALVLARAGIGLLVWLAPSGLPRVDEIGLHPVVLLFTLAMAILAGLAFGLVGVVKLRTPSVTALKEGGRSSSEGRERHRARNALVVAQVALALVLLIVSGLMVRTFVALLHVDPGFTRPEEVQTFRVAIPEALVSDPMQTVQMHEQIVERLQQLPGVQSVGLSSSVTMDSSQWIDTVTVEELPETNGQLPPLRHFKFIAPGYFETMGNRVLMGRTITWRDIHQDAFVAVVSENFAREHWKNPADALGKRIRFAAKTPWREIIGIVGNERDDGLSQAAPTIVYWPMAMKQFYADEPFVKEEQPDEGGHVSRTMTYVVRAARIHSSGFLRELQRAVWSVNPNLPLANVQTLEDIQADSMAQTAFAMVMLAIAASVALLLGLVGIYGVIAYIATQRTREIGIRMALGAQTGDVRRLFLRHGLGLTLTGIAIGLGVAMLVTRVMSALLFGVTPMDPVTYGGVALGLAAIALVATYLPARRASRIDPIIALRSEM